MSLAQPGEVYMHSNKENSTQLIQGPEKPHWAGVCDIWWENNEKGLKLEGGHRLCGCVVSLLHTFLDRLCQWCFFKYYDFPQLLSSILCLICYLRINWWCSSAFQIYAYATTADGYAPEYPLPLVFKVEDDNDNAPYFENKVTVFTVPENCRTGKFMF